MTTMTMKTMIILPSDGVQASTFSRRILMTLSPTKVLPVPGGPWMTASSLDSAMRTAAY
jgi:hypothetical protein